MVLLASCWQCTSLRVTPDVDELLDSDLEEDAIQNATRLNKNSSNSHSRREAAQQQLPIKLNAGAAGIDELLKPHQEDVSDHAMQKTKNSSESHNRTTALLQELSIRVNASAAGTSLQEQSSQHLVHQYNAHSRTSHDVKGKGKAEEVMSYIEAVLAWEPKDGQIVQLSQGFTLLLMVPFLCLCCTCCIGLEGKLREKDRVRREKMRKKSAMTSQIMSEQNRKNGMHDLTEKCAESVGFQGLIEKGKKARGEDKDARYRFGDVTRGVTSYLLGSA